MDEVRDDWKWEILQGFRQWLEELPEEDPRESENESETEPADIDLRALFAEFTALRQEVRLQNREQSRAVRELERAAETCETSAELLQRREEELADFEERVRRAAERRCLLPFLDVRDALVRGRDGTARQLEKRSLFRRPPPGIEGVVEGYELAIRRFDRALFQLGVQVVPTVGRRFDARSMKAVGTRQLDQEEDGVVVEELLGGFARGDELLRPAEVMVNQRRSTEE